MTRKMVAVDLQRDGVLWAINRVLFHPRGFALGLETDADGTELGFVLIGDGSEVWQFEESVDDDRFAAFETLLKEAAS